MPDDDTLDESEWQHLIAYRLDRFRLLGFTDGQAFELIDAGCDWHEAENLLEHGCDHATILRIRG